MIIGFIFNSENISNPDKKDDSYWCKTNPSIPAFSLNCISSTSQTQAVEERSEKFWHPPNFNKWPPLTFNMWPDAK